MARPAFLYKSDPARGAIWKQCFEENLPGIEFRQWPEVGNPAEVRFLAAWEPPPDLASRFPALEVLFSVGAGIDQFDLAELPPTLHVVRMIEPGIVAGMVEYVTLAVLALHRDLPAYLEQQRAALWQARPRLPASRRRVRVLGLGSLGRAVLSALGNFGFDCAGWSRSQRAIEGVKCLSGTEGLTALVAQTDILICLLPLTAQTRGMINASLLAKLPRGAAFVNAGRGGHVVDNDLIHALDSGHLRAAVLDVCEPEPPAPDHPFWHHPKIWMTPHVASETQALTSAEAVMKNLRRHENGQPMDGLVDRIRGY
ncbi:2-hydroxyacid dehydrogenase [Ideonella azotifigens]|uniref:Glyoxylate/hydroxypyruvate reductase A n=1 Tax=Ideonella azotifigens TaxID=513160 RepID=A0ABN1K620_9BURK